MTLSLYQRLSFSLFAVFSATLLIFIFYWQQITHDSRIEAQQRLHLSLAANLARDNPLLQQGVYDYKALENLFHTLMVLGPAFEFYYLDSAGNILTSSADPSVVKRKKINIEPIKDLTQNRKTLPIVGDDPRDVSRQKIFSAAPLFNGMELQGYLYVIVAGEKYENTLSSVGQGAKVEFSVIVITGALSFLFLLMLAMFRYFTSPIRLLAAQMKAFQMSDFNPSALEIENAKSPEDNEVAMLTQGFVQMAQQIHEQLESLSQIDAMRKELLADISHDLRTPLASLKGYIETLRLNGEKFDSDKRQRFIETALKSATELNELIDQIFELTHLESGQVNVEIETFNLSELIYDVMAKFTLQAEDKGVSLNYQQTQHFYQVCSDIGKVDRVLSNLIDNALRHTPAGGNITIQVQDADEHFLSVKISDTGSGIKPEEISYIFDARYRASNATNGKHSGLGLAITKKLLNHLNSDINVCSKYGQGTSFEIHLRKALPAK